MSQDPHPPLLSLPDLLSLSRLGMAAAFVRCRTDPERRALVLAASASDWFDGRIARRMGWTSRWGHLADPAGDRAFVLVALASLAARGVLTPAQLALLASRDLATAASFLATRPFPRLRRVTFRARPLGKVVTSLQFLALVVATSRPRALAPVVACTAVASAAALVDYGLYFLAAARPHRGSRAAPAPTPAASGTP
ncbi:CDP-alcohol phosphatidyltransferase family protein [Myxococcota bacterium]|nr:CDP-alcohol phosphatidyltransferase family protein [Myxococcota bacterium]